MTNPSKLLKEFKLSDNNLRTDPTIARAYQEYTERRLEFGDSRKSFYDASKALHDFLDGPLRRSGLIPQGKDWSLTEPIYEHGLVVRVWSEPKVRGRKKQNVPLQEVDFKNKDDEPT